MKLWQRSQSSYVFSFKALSRHLLSRWHFLEIQYLLQLRDIVCAYHLDVSENLVDHHGELLVQNGTLVDLQQGLQLG
jgi:hypothetical protein